MRYDIIVATRNRPDVLGLSIPTFLGQSRPPARLIVVDSSDDHAPVRAMVESACAAHSFSEVVVLHTKPGLTAQRNLGLRHVREGIVMFPDDDALWFAGAAEAVMRVYEADEDHSIGGVSFLEHRAPPPGIPGLDGNRGSLGARIIYRLSPIREAIEERLTPNPLMMLGRMLLSRHAAPNWLPGLRAQPVHFMLGFRMTFRTDAIRAVGFDEALEAYGLYEDFDVSLAVLKTHLLVRASDAGVYHHRAPGSRAAGRKTGVMLLLNLCYILCKHAEPGSPARRAMKRYAAMRLAQYRLRGRGEFGRERLIGVRRAASRMDDLLNADRKELPTIFKSAAAECMQ